jgi:hypothetical protein
MITSVYIIRSKDSMNKFFELDPDTGNWDWTKNLESATIFQTPDKAAIMQTQKLANEDTYIYEIPYSIVQPQSRKKKSSKTKPKSKRKTKSKRGK